MLKVANLIGWGLVFQGVRDFYHFKFISGEPNFYHFKWFRACNFYWQSSTYPKISLALRAPGPRTLALISAPDSLSTRRGLTGDAVALTTTLLSGRRCTWQHCRACASNTSSAPLHGWGTCWGTENVSVTTFTDRLCSTMKSQTFTILNKKITS